MYICIYVYIYIHIRYFKSSARIGGWRTTNYADKSINDYMVEKHHAVRYYGQSKDDIEHEHIKNRELVILNE